MPNGGEILLDACKLGRRKNPCFVFPIKVGIEETIMNRIFEPLFTNKKEGVGLGLSLCRELVTRHGGSIKAKFTPTKEQLSRNSEEIPWQKKDE